MGTTLACLRHVGATQQEMERGEVAYGLGEQLEPNIWKQLCWDSRKPWRKRSRSAWRGYYKAMKNRRERRRARLNPKCVPEYKRYKGWEY